MMRHFFALVECYIKMIFVVKEFNNVDTFNISS